MTEFAIGDADADTVKTAVELAENPIFWHLAQAGTPIFFYGGSQDPLWIDFQKRMAPHLTSDSAPNTLVYTRPDCSPYHGDNEMIDKVVAAARFAAHHQLDAWLKVTESDSSFARWFQMLATSPCPTSFHACAQVMADMARHPETALETHREKLDALHAPLSTDAPSVDPSSDCCAD